MTWNPNQQSEEDYESALIFDEDLQNAELDEELDRWCERPVGEYGLCSGCGNDLAYNETDAGLCEDCQYPDRPILDDLE